MRSAFGHPAGITNAVPLVFGPSHGIGPQGQMLPEDLRRASQHVQQPGAFMEAAPPMPSVQQSPYMQTGGLMDLQGSELFQNDPVRPGLHGGHPRFRSQVAQPLPETPQLGQRPAQEALEPLARPPFRKSQGPTITDGSPQVSLDNPSEAAATSQSPAEGLMGVSSEALERARHQSVFPSGQSSRFDRSQSHARPPAGMSLSASGRSLSAVGRPPSDASLVSMLLADRLVAGSSSGPSPSGSSSAVATSSLTAEMGQRVVSPGAPRGQKRDSPDPEGAQQDQSTEVGQPVPVEFSGVPQAGKRLAPCPEHSDDVVTARADVADC